MGLKPEMRPDLAGAKELMAETEAAGPRATVGDATGDKAIKASEDEFSRHSEKFQNWKLGENRKAQDFAESSAERLQRLLRETKWEGLDEVNRVILRGRGGKRYAAAKAIKAEIKAAGIDNEAIEKASGKLQYLVEKIKADELANQAQSIAQKYGPVEGGAAAAKLENLYNEIAGDSANSDATKSMALKMAEAFKRAEYKPTPAVPEYRWDGKIIREAVPASTPPVGTPQNMSWKGLRQTLSTINKAIAAENKTLSPSGASVEKLERAANIVEGLLDDHASKYPDLKAAHEAFSAHYKGKVVPYKDSTFGRVLADADATKASKIFEGTDLAEKKRYLGLLGAKGQAAARSRLVTKAVEAGRVPKQGVKGMEMDPGKVADELHKLDKNGTLELLFPGEERKAVEGMEKVLRTVRSLGKIEAEAPASLIGNVRPTRSSIVHEYLSRGWYKMNEDRYLRMYTDPNSKLFLKKAADMEVGSPELVKWIAQFGKTSNDRLKGK
jgi:hypothetical protein